MRARFQASSLSNVFLSKTCPKYQHSCYQGRHRVTRRVFLFLRIRSFNSCRRSCHKASFASLSVRPSLRMTRLLMAMVVLPPMPIADATIDRPCWSCSTRLFLSLTALFHTSEDIRWQLKLCTSYFPWCSLAQRRRVRM